MTPSRYTTPQAFKQALEDRLRRLAGQQNLRLSRLRQRLVFERFLVRVFSELGEGTVLKGGVVLELRLPKARATRDVDLRCTGNPSELLPRLMEAGRRDEGDCLTFEVEVNPQGGLIQGDGIIYEGRRFRAQAYMAGRLYGEPFGVDAAFADKLIGEPEHLDGSDVLAFAHIPRPRLLVYPRETHVAEKLHAYTLPRSRDNSRVKDLPDLALLGQTGRFRRDVLYRALHETFAFRRQQSLPPHLPLPPEWWAPLYEQMAHLFELPWPTLTVVHQAASVFLDPVLGGLGGPTWDPHRWSWD